MNGKKIGYVRVSTLEQNTERQLNGINLDKVFEDKCSGKDTNRPQLKLCLDYLRDGDTLYIHSIDRLARSLRDLLNIVQELLSKKVSIHFVKENMEFNGDKPNPNQTLYLNILGAVAEFERQMIRERQREGIALARQRNAYDKCGRKPSLTEKQIDEINNRLTNNETVSALAKEYDVSRQTIYVHCKKD
ncbi:MAG: recombinase family protein [Desulfovibrionaceae bacterium]|nr:recombinase family protein [Desulfovibrionaceae bacterium]